MKNAGRLVAISASALSALVAALELLNLFGAVPETVPVPSQIVRKAIGGSSNRQFQNSFLRAEARSVSVAEDGRQATLALRVENVTNEPVGIALNGYEPARLIDDQGNSMEAEEVSGVVDISRRSSARDLSEYTVLSAGSATTVVFVFEEGSTPVQGSTLAFSADFYKFEGDGSFSQFSVGLSDLAVPAGG